MVPQLFFSQRIDHLVELLIVTMDSQPIGPLETRTILVPNSQLKQWLFLEIARRKSVAMGLKIKTVAEAFPSHFSSLELILSIYDALRNSLNPDLLDYLNGKKGRLLAMTNELMPLFLSYGQFGKDLFANLPTGWQQDILRQLFIDGPWRLPVQVLSAQAPGPVFCFAIDFLPPAYWEFLLKSPALALFQFSPCADFWEDVCTDRERRNIRRFWKKKKASEAALKDLDHYLREAPPLLANWGKLGRENLRIFSHFDLQINEAYAPLEPTSMLKTIQHDLLHFKKSEILAQDDSIQVFLTGSSRLKEIECLKNEILRSQIPFHEISVLAPDIEPYVPLIEFIFSDLPYRISGFDIATQSSFRQGLSRLMDLGRWSAENILNLFETPSFYRKRGWEEEQLLQFRIWIESAQIKWGRNAKQRSEILSETFGNQSFDSKGSWEAGLDRLLETLIYIRPLQISADLFEEFLVVIQALEQIHLVGEKTLLNWAEEIEKLASEFLEPDLADEADVAAYHSFRESIFNLKTSRLEERTFPFEVIQRLFLLPCPGQIHPSHLHAIRFASIEDAALLPAKAVFLIGMDEESFPRKKISPSFDLLKGKIPDLADKDRYLFLEALFGAEERFTISYGHLSQNEGKPVGPSLLVQELMSAVGLTGTVYQSPSPPSARSKLLWPKLKNVEWPREEITIPLSELSLLARHPWKFYLQKVLGIYLNEPLPENFNLQKAMLLREAQENPIDEVLENADLPIGPLGEALRLDILEKANERRAQLAEWQVEPCTINSEIQIDNVRIVGEIKQASTRGFICAQEDKIEGLIKTWPQALCTACSLGINQVLMLRSGKIKTLGNPKESLKAFAEYYFHCLQAPSPLIPDWVDPFLRKAKEKKSQFKDPVAEWVMARYEMGSYEELLNEWRPLLNTAFRDLIALYPTRGKAHAEI